MGAADPSKLYGDLDADLAAALRALAEAPTRIYYDGHADASAREIYYEALHRDSHPGRFYWALARLLEETHRIRLEYRPALYLYPWVDLRETHPALTVQSIYSGQQLDPEDLVRADAAVDAARVEAVRESLAVEGPISFARLLENVARAEASFPYNCEHVVPQSWFGERAPMKGDLHHLFTCELECNHRRAHYPLAELPGAPADDCGRLEHGRFEPRGGKGAVARATLYFILRYPGTLRRVPYQYDEAGVETLLRWHTEDPPGRYERHRNAAIFEAQGNRNPLIDHPEWAERLDFLVGLR